jgi:putative hydrolase of the HAD superfamily
MNKTGEKMTVHHPITTLFLDIGGVLLTNGWDRKARMQAAERFQIDFMELDERHHLTFDTYEEGKLTLEEYLERVVFFTRRPFSKKDFRAFMFSRSQPYDEAIDFIRVVKAHNHLKTVAVSNEGCELTRYRIQQFKLDEVIDAFVSSCFVHYRKPDKDIYHIALNISQSKPEQVAYIDDRRLFVEVAKGLGIHGITYTSLQDTREALENLGLKIK